MVFVDPSRYADERQALHQQDSQHYDPRPPKRRHKIRALVRRVLGRTDKKDQ